MPKRLFLSIFTTIYLFTAGAFAADLPIYFTGKVTGELVASVLTREKFEFEPGTITYCKRTDVPPYLTSFVCDIKDVSASIKAGEKNLAVTLNSLVAFYKTHTSGTYREYNYKGTSADGPIVLVLWHYVKSPELIKGFIRFEGLGLSMPIVAKPTP